ncbi:MAG: hypothetical protein ISS72_10405 [Candidatus Brocadiae bacterium]|nr:hypothetical protein [Candidatus Brocadiia bacterium]
MPSKKDLHEVVIDALRLLGQGHLPELRLGSPKRRLVAASGNAMAAGKIIFADEDAVFADEGQYRRAIERIPGVDGAAVISASGQKDASSIVGFLKDKVETYLLTCNGDSAAAQLLPQDHVVVTPRNPEPITYNTSTYLGMILAKTGEAVEPIAEHIEREVAPRIPSDLSKYSAFYLIIEPEFDLVREMLVTKFDELFGPMLTGRCYTWRQTLHAKNVVPSERELFISFGYDNELFGHEDARLNIPLPPNAGYAAMVAVGYYVIGRIQSQFSPWFKWNADRYELWQKKHLP